MSHFVAIWDILSTLKMFRKKQHELCLPPGLNQKDYWNPTGTLYEDRTKWRQRMVLKARNREHKQSSSNDSRTPVGVAFFHQNSDENDNSKR